MLLPTPRAAAQRTSHTAATRQDSRSGPSLAQAIEIANHQLPHEFDSWDDLPNSWQPKLLPTPRTTDCQGSGKHGDGGLDLRTVMAKAHGSEQWGEFEPAVRRWEKILGRAVPAPTEINRNGNPRLRPEFDEWMMGLPKGWLDVNIPYGAKIKLCGNGCVPQQAELALRELLA